MPAPVLQAPLTLPALDAGKNYTFVIAATNSPTGYALSSISAALNAVLDNSGPGVLVTADAFTLPASLGGSDSPAAYSFKIDASNGDGDAGPQNVPVNFRPVSAAGIATFFAGDVACDLYGVLWNTDGFEVLYYFFCPTSFVLGTDPISSSTIVSPLGVIGEPGAQLSFILKGADGAISCGTLSGTGVLPTNRLMGSAYQIAWQGAVLSNNAGVDSAGSPIPNSLSSFLPASFPWRIYHFGSVVAAPTNLTPDINSPEVWQTQAGMGDSYNITSDLASGVSFAVLSALPAGLTFDTETAQISGTTTTPGTYFVTLQATANGNAYQRYLVIQVADPEAPQVVTDYPSGTPYFAAGIFSIPINEAISIQLEASGSPTSWTATGLPAGLAINNSGLISGTATALGSHSVTVTASTADAAGIPARITIAVVGITTGNLSARRNAAASLAINQNWGAITAATWTVLNLPPGLATGTSSASSIQITGTPTVTGVFPVNVTVAQTGGGPSLSKTINITVTPGIPVITVPSSLWTGTGYGQISAVGTPISIPCTATDSPTAWSATGLPDGVGIDNTGLISGTPVTVGTYAVSVTATNATGTSAAVTITLQIAAASGGGTGSGSGTATAPSLYLPWLHSDPTLIDLQMNLRTGAVQSFYGVPTGVEGIAAGQIGQLTSSGLYVKAGDDLRFAVVIQDLILGTMLTALNDLFFVICPVDDFESFYAEVQNVEAVDTGSGTYFALTLRLDAAMCPRLQEDFNALDIPQGPNPAARTLIAMCELRIVTVANFMRRSLLFPMVIEQNASI